jgi:hypothetical protein
MALKSRFEEQIMGSLAKQGLDVEYEPVKLKYTIEGKYTPDIRLPNGILIELKGRFRKDAQVKMRAVKAAHPELDIRFVFQKASITIDGSKMTCIDYANKYGFPYADGQIPRSWFDE